MNIDKLLGNLSDDQKDLLRKTLNDLDRVVEETLDIIKETSEDEDLKKEKEPTNIDKDFTVKNGDTNKKGRIKVKGGKNKWEDTGELSHIETPDFERTERRRSPPKKTEVICHVCGKTFKVSPKLVYGEYHRCNRCTGR
jgi:hypothetical protein